MHLKNQTDVAFLYLEKMTKTPNGHIRLVDINSLNSIATTYGRRLRNKQFLEWAASTQQKKTRKKS